MKRKRIKLIFLYIPFIFIAFFIKNEAYPQEAERVKVYYQPLISMAPILIAYEEGYFKKEGVEIEFIKARETGEALMLLLQGSLDVVSGPPTGGIYNAVKGGKNIEIVAGYAYYVKGNKFAGIAMKRNLVDSTDISFLFKNLKGKKVAVPILGSLPHYFIERLLKENGMSIKDIELVVMPFDSIAVAINSGVLDAGFLVEPFITLLKSKSDISFISFGDEFPDTPSAFITYGDNLLKKNPQVGIKFMAAYLMGCKQYSKGKTKRNIEILKRYLILDEEMLKSMEWPVIRPEGINDIKILNDYQDWLFEKHYIDGKIDIKLLVDTSFMEKANNILHNSGANR